MTIGKKWHLDYLYWFLLDIAIKQIVLIVFIVNNGNIANISQQEWN